MTPQLRGRRLKMARRLANVSQQELAAAARYSRLYLILFESERLVPSEAEMQNLEDTLQNLMVEMVEKVSEVLATAPA